MYRQIKATLIQIVLIVQMTSAKAGEVPPGNIIISIGANALSMIPAKDSAIGGFRLDYPGFYAKISGESYSNAMRFIHVDLNMSLNKGIIDNGVVKVSRLNFNFGFGRTYERVKFSFSPGLCYSQIAYQNNVLNKVVTESRFAPSLGIQTDLIVIKSPYQYLGLFVEGSVMFAKPSRWVQQLAVGISWKPSFRKKRYDKYLPK